MREIFDIQAIKAFVVYWREENKERRINSGFIYFCEVEFAKM